MSTLATGQETSDLAYDETRWMAIAIELLAVVCAIAFALVQS